MRNSSHTTHESCLVKLHPYRISPTALLGRSLGRQLGSRGYRTPLEGGISEGPLFNTKTSLSRSHPTSHNIERAAKRRAYSSTKVYDRLPRSSHSQYLMPLQEIPEFNGFFFKVMGVNEFPQFRVRSLGVQALGT